MEGEIRASGSGPEPLGAANITRHFQLFTARYINCCALTKMSIGIYTKKRGGTQWVPPLLYLEQ